MGEEQEAETLTLLKYSKTAIISVGCGVILMLIAAGSMLISTGELKKAVSVSELNDNMLLTLSKKNSERISNIEINQEKRYVIDSAFRADTKKSLYESSIEIKGLRSSMNRLEWQHKLPPIDTQPSINKNSEMIPFDVSQLSLQNYHAVN